MDNRELLKTVLSDRAMRIAYFERDFYRFALYHFSHIFTTDSAPFHKIWADALASGDDAIIKGFRESGKTVWLTVYYAWCIAYKKKRFIMHYCFDKGKAESRLFDLITQLKTSTTYIDDYGEMYPSALGSKDSKKKAGVKEFITTNDVMVKAMSMGISPRGANFMAKDGSYRPDLIGADDIDVQKSVANARIISKNFDFITGEVLGGMADGGQFVLLGNVIKKDGVVPRMEDSYNQDDSWRCFVQSIYDNGDIAWQQRYVETDEEAEITGKASLESKKRKLKSRSYAQNFLLVPATDEGGIIRREHINYGYFESNTIVIGVDPAFSTKTLSDAFAISVVAHDGERKNIRAVYALVGKEKDHDKALDFVYRLYKETNANAVNFEAVAAQSVMAKMLRAKGVNVNEVRPHADKATRLGEIQPLFEGGQILFDREGPGIQAAIEEVIDFPNGIHDDRVDAIIYGCLSYKVYEPYFG